VILSRKLQVLKGLMLSLLFQSQPHLMSLFCVLFFGDGLNQKKSNSEKEKEEKNAKKMQKKTRFVQDFIMAADKIRLNLIKIRFV
jgi:hypothetical protein